MRPEALILAEPRNRLPTEQPDLYKIDKVVAELDAMVQEGLGIGDKQETLLATLQRRLSDRNLSLATLKRAKKKRHDRAAQTVEPS